MPLSSPTLPIAIIGAGMAGLAAADYLVSHGRKAVLFDKGRGPGGRMSTRRMTDANGVERQFDHGAQYFTARDPHFIAQTEKWAAANIVARWPAASADAWTGVPAMNAPIKAMASAHIVHWARRIAALAKRNDGWCLTAENGAENGEEFGPYSAVIIAVPAEQVAQLSAAHHPDFTARAKAIQSAPCWTVMLGFAAPLPTNAVAIKDFGPIGWAARNNAKPGRHRHENWVIQASASWSKAHLEDDKDTIIAPLSMALADALGLADMAAPEIAAAHRWRYAMVPVIARTNSPFAWDDSLNLGMCGDWLAGPRIENAWLSGHLLAKQIISI